jgi:SAM-dependent methyltransferase
MPDARSTAAHYDTFYAAGDFAKPRGFAEAIAARMMVWLPASARILEAGCGTGALVAACRARGLAATGFDLSRVGLQQADRRAKGVFVQADGLHPPFPTQQVDAVLCSALSLFNVPDLASALPAARCLTALVRPGGLFVFIGTSALHPNPDPDPTWHWHTLSAFRVFLGALGTPLLLRVTAYRLVGRLGAHAFDPPASALGTLWTRASGRPGVVLGIVRVCDTVEASGK